MSLVSPLNKVLGLGSAKEGAQHWWAQRLSAVALIPLGLWFVFDLAGMGNFEYGTVVGFISSPIRSILLILLIITLAYHSQLGIQVVVEDYVHGSSLKIAAIVITSFAHIFVVVGGVFSVLKIALGTTV
ncbi:MAG: succinate dehydrogenase, hydrophobic membrane anchor protein [Rhodospirillaceae bacterium]|nr:succinate dehydrogenase, hydrophobic membrane anchor protein [Rhodospirillaceae bacterium]|tara:strand:+ start:323 stop:709 length:387 start_codon:yes stop_codon:yes gene_type:complete